MKKTLAFMMLLAVCFTSCDSSTQEDLCEFNGYTVESVSQEETDCGCGPAYYIHLRNEHKFKDVRVNKSAFNYYGSMLKQAKANSTVAVIDCKDFVELKQD